MNKFCLFCLLFLSSCATKRAAVEKIPTTQQSIQRPESKKAKPQIAYKKRWKKPENLVTAPTETQTPKTFRVAIDAGHGGKDPGTKALNPPFTKEKVLALRTALKVEEFLIKWGYEVYLTRRSDIFIPLLKRAELAEKNQCNLFVSIHYNSAKRAAASGIELYYYGKDKMAPRTTLSKELAQCILARMAKVSKTGSKRIASANFAVIRETKMPAVLIEGGFLSNPQEAKKLRNPQYLRFLSWSIAKGIEDYIKNVPGAN